MEQSGTKGVSQEIVKAKLSCDSRFQRAFTCMRLRFQRNYLGWFKPA